MSAVFEQETGHATADLETEEMGLQDEVQMQALRAVQERCREYDPEKHEWLLCELAELDDGEQSTAGACGDSGEDCFSFLF